MGGLGFVRTLNAGERNARSDTRKLGSCLTTESTLEEANKLGRTLVEERLVACATLLPVVQSIYHWKDQIQSAAGDDGAAEDEHR